jgi:murein DD-endopeptidase MepM/ murein hydrolase activator NlpD|tara:strand:- start:1305 stop:7541 length:6237 start_codon:yes stop_codon:yes gene_type:complete
MADEIINASEKVYVEQICDNLVLIDPNKITSSNGQSIEDRLVRHEDLCIYVNLVARVIPRSKLVVGKGASDTGVKVELFDGEINFLKPVGKSSLDSDWTEGFTDPSVNKIQRQEDTNEKGQTFLSKTIENKNDFQGFGIKNIDIKISSSFIPEVTITFVDVRGKTLFEQAETNTPYTAFFHLPYPQFELTVKGYYGQAVKYQLALTNFKASFDSNSGDYNVTANFIGNHIALLNDINLQQAMLAPYLYPSKTQVSGSLEVEQKGLGRKILDEVYNIYKELQLIPQDFPHLTIFELIGKVETFTDNLKKNFKKVDLEFTNDQKLYQNKLKTFYNAIFGTNGWVENYINKEGSILLDVSVGSSTGGGKKVVAAAFKLKETTTEYIQDAETKLKYIIEGYKKILGENNTFGVGKGRGSVNLVKDFTLENQRARSNNAKNINEVPEQGWYVLDDTPKSFGGVFTRVLAEFEKNYNEIQSEVTKKLNKVFKESLTVDPTIRNLTAVVIAGVDTYLRILDRVHTEAFEQRNNPDRIKAVITDKQMYKDAVKGETTVFPWPQYYEFDDKENKLVLKYPGAAGSLSTTKAYSKKIWPEVEFIEEYTKSVLTRKNESQLLTNNEETFVEVTPISVREFPFSNEMYKAKTKYDLLWEIIDRANDFTQYVGVTGYQLGKPKQLSDVIIQAASNDSKNLEFAIKENLELSEFFKDNGLDNTKVLEQLSTSTPDKFLLWDKFKYINTPYINNRVNNNNIKGSLPTPFGTNFGLYPTSSVKEKYTSNGDYGMYKNLYLESKKTTDAFFDFYPFNYSNKNLVNRLAGGYDIASGSDFFLIDELDIQTQTNVYGTENHKLFFSNLNWESDKYGNFGIMTKPDQLDVIKTFKLETDWAEYYDTTEQDILLQPLTEGINNTSNLKQCVSMLNTPWFANAIYRANTKETTSTTDPYTESAYLFLNSLPIASTLEKVIKEFNNKNQYGGYVAQLIKQLAGYHELPYSFILKIGSIWWNYKTNIAQPVEESVFVGLGGDSLTNMGEDGNISCDKFYVDSGYANAFGFYDFTHDGNILPGLNTTNVTLGLWPRLIDATNNIVTGTKVLSPVGVWVPTPILQNNFTNTFQLEIEKEENLSFDKDGISYNFYTTFADSATIGNAGIKDVDATADPYYILYPSAGGLVNTDLSFMGGNINTAGFDGSARFLWAGAGYGAFDVNNVGTPGSYGAIYGWVPPSSYMKKINESISEQEAWNINTGVYDGFNELLSVFPSQVLDEFEKQFLNFSQSQNPDASVVEGKYSNFKSIFKDFMVLKKSEVDSEKPVVTTEELAKSQYKKFLNVCRIFLNQSVIYKHGSVNGWDITVTPSTSLISGNTTSTLSLVSYILSGNTTLGLTKFDTSIITPTNTFKNEISLHVFPREFIFWPNIEFNRVTKICLDFFKEYDISHTLVYQFAPILKTYITSTEQNSPGGSVGMGKSTFSLALTNILKAMDETSNLYTNTLLKAISKIDPFKALNESTNTAGDDDEDQRPKIVADNLKLELYQVFKTFNDKWISGTKVQGDDVNTSRTAGSNVTFHNTVMERFMFLDNANRDIGNEAIVDIYMFLGLDTPFTNEPSTSVKQTIGGFISHMCSVNSFLFIPLPAYVNFYNMQGNNTQAQGDTMFGAFKEVDTTKSSPKYLCQYVGPPSTSLDIKSFNYGYNNDSFVLNRVSPNPLCGPIPNSEKERQLSNKVMAFAVDFGIPNQQIFESIGLDQSEFPSTSEAFRITEDLGKMASGSKVSTNSLNLFNLYKSRSYKCTVTSMGNALIQPTTYFQLRYVPMFSGPYLIMDVSHSITPNDMTTTFTGVRVGITSLPKVTDMLATIQEKLLKQFDEIEETITVNKEDSHLDEFNLTSVEVDNNIMDSETDISSLDFPIQDPVDLNKISTPQPNQAFWARRTTNSGGVKMHKGIDYQPKLEFEGVDINILSPVSGIVTKKFTGCVAGSTEKAKKCGGGYGNSLYVDKILIKQTDTTGWVEGAISRYQFRIAHLKENTIIGVTEGQGVNKGVKVGVMGTTGNSTGIHLHYEIRKYVINKNLGEDETFLNPNNFNSEYLNEEKTT